MKVAGGQLHRVSGAMRRKAAWGEGAGGGYPPCWGGSQQIFKFCIPRDAFWCIFRAKKCLFGGHCKLNYKQEFFIQSIRGLLKSELSTHYFYFTLHKFILWRHKVPGAHAKSSR